MPPVPPLPPGVLTITIEDEMKRSYLDYAMSVIVSRALPDVRDGLKPVHRRILFSMKEQGYDWNRTYHKSARVVGDVMGKYHPHGDSAIYDAMVRMAQTFSMRLPLIDGQGNFGSMDGDPAAAMRYTEVRLAKSAHELLEDIDKDTVDFQENYDNSSREPTVLPARYPNLLVNGASGIAVGMATNIPPHNLGEVIDACCLLLNDPETSIDQLMECVPGPDFPTGGIIYGSAGIHSALHSGRGSVIMRGRTEIESLGRDREAIIVSEIPYQVNKSRMMEQIAEVVRDKKVEGISDLRDESDRHGVRVVIELKRDAMHELVLNQLFRFTQLQTSFGVNMLALRAGRPEMMNLRDILTAFIEFREQVITRRTIFHLSKARDRAHILVGLAISVANLDDIIALVRAAKDPQAARENLMTKPWPAKDVAPLIELIDEPGRAVIDGNYQLSEAQARAILELRLHRLTGLERDKIATELHEVCAEISQFLGILASREKLRGMLRDEVLKVKEEFATPRRTELVESEAEVDIEDLIQREDMVVTVSHAGYIKRVALSTYRPQRRGGKGRAGMATRDEDFVSKVFVVNTHTPVLFFSNHGRVYKMKTYRMPLAAPNARGRPMQNLLPLAEGEVIQTLMPLPEDEADWVDLQVMFATLSGTVRRNAMSDFTNVKANGKIAMRLDDDDRIVNVRACSENDDIMLSAVGGKCIRFRASDVRLFKGRDSIGVRGMRLESGDGLRSMTILRHVEVSAEEARAYVKQANALRRGDEAAELQNGDDATDEDEVTLAPERFEELAAAEQLILTITANGYGKRTSALEYRVTNRGGQGIINIITSARNGAVVQSGPVDDSDHIVLVTDGGKLIRCPVNDIRIAGRNTQGVTLFNVSDDEHVVSVTRLSHNGDANGDGDDDDDDESGAAQSGDQGGDAGGDAADDAGGEPAGGPAAEAESEE
ncbi:MAG: DNA gyrase subunit A [Alphaproteobacteria bacterium]|nr:DNA gyrase subunit A [Alphaproteobacteria bacterium]